MKNCLICGSNSFLLGKVDLNKSGNDKFINSRTFPKSTIVVEYFRCSNCYFIEAPIFKSWSESDFKSKIYNKDYYKADPPFEKDRPQRCFEIFSLIFADNFKSKKILDFGGGNGYFKKLLVENGHRNSFSYDPFYGLNLDHEQKYSFDLITSFEVIEHIPNQNKTWEEIFSFLNEKGILLISTLIQPNNIEDLKTDWWYLSPRNGHVCAHSVLSLKIIAENNNLKLFSLNSELHFFYRNELPDYIINLPPFIIPSVFIG